MCAVTVHGGCGEYFVHVLFTLLHTDTAVGLLCFLQVQIQISLLFEAFPAL